MVRSFVVRFLVVFFQLFVWEVWFLYKTFFVDENILVFRRWRCLWVCILVGLREKKKKKRVHTHSLSFQGYLTGLHYLWERAVEVRDHLMSLRSSFFSKRNAFTHQPTTLPTHPPARLLSSKSHFYSIMILSVLTFEESSIQQTWITDDFAWKMRH